MSTIDAPAPTVQPGAAPMTAMVTPPTLDPGYVTAGEQALRASPAVTTAIGAAFNIVSVEPVGRHQQPSGIAFLVHTPQPVTMPTGTKTTTGAGEGQPSSVGPSTTPMGPLSYIYVIFGADFANPVFQPVPDALAEHDTLPN